MRPLTGPPIIVWTLSNDSGHKHPTSYSIELLGWTEPWLPKNVQINAWRNGHFSSACIPFLSLQLLSRTYSTTTECFPSSACCSSQYHCSLAEEWLYLLFADDELGLCPWALDPYPITSHCQLSAPSQWPALLWGKNPKFYISGILEGPALWPFSRTLTWLVQLQMDTLKLHVSQSLFFLPFLPTHCIHKRNVSHQCMDDQRQGNLFKCTLGSGESRPTVAIPKRLFLVMQKV